MRRVNEIKLEEPFVTPVFVGFGSIVVQDPDRLTQIVMDAIEKSGRRGNHALYMSVGMLLWNAIELASEAVCER